MADRSTVFLLKYALLAAALLFCVIGCPLSLFWWIKSMSAGMDENTKPLVEAREAIVADLEKARLNLHTAPKITGTYVAVHHEKSGEHRLDPFYAPEGPLRPKPPFGDDEFVVWFKWKPDPEAEKLKLFRGSKEHRFDVEAEVFVCDRRKQELIATWQYKGYVERRYPDKGRRVGPSYVLKMPEAELQQWIDSMLQ
jgi:hypothetical protein